MPDTPTASDLPAGADTPLTVEKGSSLGRDAWLRLKKNRLAMISLWFIVAMILGILAKRCWCAVRWLRSLITRRRLSTGC